MKYSKQSALTVVVIQRTDTKTPTTTTKKNRKMAVVTGDDVEPGPLLHRRPSGITAAAAEAIAEGLGYSPPLSCCPPLRLRRSGPGVLAVFARRVRLRYRVRLLELEEKWNGMAVSAGIVGTGSIEGGIEQRGSC